MEGDNGELDFGHALRRLSADPDALPWPCRRACAEQLMAAFRAGGVVDREAVMVPLLELLAGDPKWEVRKAVADDLHYIRQSDFDRLAEKLRGDTNAFVSRAAESSRKRRRKVKAVLKEKLQGIDVVLEQYQDLKERHGEEVAGAAMRMGETYHMALAANMAHEMKNDLGVLRGRVSSLRRGMMDGSLEPALALASLEKVAAILFRHDGLVQQMLEYARSRATPTSPTVQSVSGLIAAGAARIADQAASRDGWSRVALEADVQEELSVFATGWQIEQALFNIMANAFDAAATAERPRVVVTGKPVNSSEVALVVQDNGPGMEAADMAELFTPGRTTKHGGSGFGLVIARNYVEIHDGELVVASTPGEGTTVTMLLPRARPGGNRAQSPSRG